MSDESRGTVLAALAANSAITVGKLVAGLVTGSAALLAEAGHSAADTVNQVFLLVGLNLSGGKPDAKHPHGYGKEAFFWSFLAAIFIFVAGAAFSFYEGIRTLVQHQEHHRSAFELGLAFGVLGMAFLFETFSWIVAVRGLLAGARRKAWSLRKFMKQSPDLTLKTVFWEDSAALTGLVLAASGLALSEVTGNETWDGVASMAIGIVLTLVAIVLGLQARDLLLGAAADDETQAEIAATVNAFPEVDGIVRLLTMQLGSHSILVNGEIRVRRGLQTADLEDLMKRIDAELATRVPTVVDTFWELHPGAS